MPKTDAETSTHEFNPQRAVRRLSRLEVSAQEFETRLLKLVQTARQRKQERALLDALEPLGLEFFASLSAIEAVLILADGVGRGDAFMAKFAGFDDAAVPPPRWSTSDTRKAVRKRAGKHEVGRSVVRALASLKYVQSPGSFASLRAAADFYAPRVELPDALVDTLFENRKDAALDKEPFRLKLQSGFAYEQVLADFHSSKGKQIENVPEVGDGGELWADGAFTPPPGAAGEGRRPTLFLTFHGSLFHQTKAWYKTVFPDGVRMGTGQSDKIVSSKENANGALLQAYRSLAGGTPLLIAADSPLGVAKNLLTVLGREIPAADGFVFLAFETKADVYWLMVTPEGGRLTPQLIPGPKRETGEKMPAYRERLVAFVGGQIADYVTGDPALVALPAKWAELLSGRREAYKERHYKPGAAE